jgi:hypothetical protein
MSDDEAIAGIAYCTGNDPQARNPRPRRTETRKDLEDRVRLCVDGLVLDQNYAEQPSRVAQVILDYRLTDGRLLGGEAKNAGRIMPDHEPDPCITEIADAVEQDQGRWHSGYLLISRYPFHISLISRLGASVLPTRRRA